MIYGFLQESISESVCKAYAQGVYLEKCVGKRTTDKI